MRWAVLDGKTVITTLASCDRAHANSVLESLIEDPAYPNSLTLKNLTPWWAFWRP